MRTIIVLLALSFLGCQTSHERPCAFVHPPMGDGGHCSTSCHVTGDAGVAVGFVPMPSCQSE